MKILIESIKFSGKTNRFNCNYTDKFVRKRSSAPEYLLQTQPYTDTFTKTTPDIKDILKNIKRGRFINQGRHAEVYETNYRDFVLRIIRGYTFNPSLLTPAQDENGLIVAASKDNAIQLQRYIKGEPLYGRNWDILYCNIDKNEYMETFNKIKELPDESFAEYIRNIINLRKNGYDIDSVNPNNILLDGTHLNIIDISKKDGVEPVLYVADFDPIVNRTHINSIIPEMKKAEADNFAGDIKILYDRIMNIAKKEGYEVDIELIPFSVIYNLYFKDWNRLNVHFAD